MKRIACLILCLALTPMARAGDKEYGCWLWEVFCPGRLQLPLCCPDDYCPKPLPELGCAPGKCYPTDGCAPKPKCWWLRCWR